MLFRSLNLAGLDASLKKAFSKRVRAVCLVINSPGGSPVQSSQIAGRIRQLSQDEKIPVFAFAEDIAASGGYWIASQANEIISEPTTLTGSIGVYSGKFTLGEALAKFGVDVREIGVGIGPLRGEPARVGLVSQPATDHLGADRHIAGGRHIDGEAEPVEQLRAQFTLFGIHGADQNEPRLIGVRHPITLDMHPTHRSDSPEAQASRGIREVAACVQGRKKCIGRATGDGKIRRIAKNRPSLGEGANHHAVPRRDHFVVARRRNTQ